jgi:hypothetical protein
MIGFVTSIWAICLRQRVDFVLGTVHMKPMHECISAVPKYLPTYICVIWIHFKENYVCLPITRKNNLRVFWKTKILGTLLPQGNLSLKNKTWKQLNFLYIKNFLSLALMMIKSLSVKWWNNPSPNFGILQCMLQLGILILFRIL